MEWVSYKAFSTSAYGMKKKKTKNNRFNTTGPQLLLSSITPNIFFFRSRANLLVLNFTGNCQCCGAADQLLWLPKTLSFHIHHSQPWASKACLEKKLATKMAFVASCCRDKLLVAVLHPD